MDQPNRMRNLPWPAICSSACKKCDDSVFIATIPYGRMMVAFGDEDQAAVAKGPCQRLGRSDEIVFGSARHEDRLREGVQLLGREDLAGPAYAGSHGQKVVARLFAKDAKLLRHGIGDFRRVLGQKTTRDDIRALFGETEIILAQPAQHGS